MIGEMTNISHSRKTIFNADTTSDRFGLVIAARYLHKCWALYTAAIYQAGAELGKCVGGILDRVGGLYHDTAIVAFCAAHYQIDAARF